MRLRTARDGPDPVPRRPTHQDFTGSAAQRAVIKETVQHPATILPVALGIAAGLLTIITREPAVFLAALTLVGVGASAWIYNFGVRGAALAERYIARQRELQKEYDRREIERLRTECEAIEWSEGAKEAAELHTAYLAAKEGLSHRGETPANLLRFEGLADQALRDGIELLITGCATFRSVDREKTKKTEEELAEFARELARSDLSEGERRVLEAKIASHSTLVESYRRTEADLASIIASLNKLGNDLERLRLNAARGSTGVNLFGPGEARSDLDVALEVRTKVEERLRGLGGADHPDDAEYTRLGQSARQRARDPE